MSVKILSNAWSIESVRTYVPLIIATPSTIAIAVSAVRSLRLRSPRMANFVISAYSYAIAWSGFSFAARRAGMIAARIPMMIATTVSTISCVHGIEKRTSNSLERPR